MKRNSIFTIVLAILLTVPAVAQSSGSIAGRVVDETGAPLPGAEIKVLSTRQVAYTDRSGSYRISPVGPGTYEIAVSYIGFEEQRLSAEVTPGGTARADAKLNLDPALFAQSIEVVAEPILEGQAKALNQQKNSATIKNLVSADQIGAFPDPNSAEAAQRVPGITIQRDQGEGRYVIVRGTEARLNSMMLNGDRMPSPEGDVRNVALDVIPAELLEAIEVSKALTPDMDADAIGGTVNLITKEAPDRQKVNVTLGGGYNDIVEDYSGNVSFFYGNSSGKTGYTLMGSAMQTDRGSENFEVAYDDGDLDELEYRDYTIRRERYGLNLTTRHDVSDRTSLFFKGVYNQFDDQEYRQRVRNRVGDDRMERELKDRFESQQIMSFSAGGQNLVGSSSTIDYKVSWSYAEEEEPNRVDSTFRQRNVEFDPNVGPDFIDPNDIQANPLNEDYSAYTLNEIVVEDNITTEDDLVAAFNYNMPYYRDANRNGVWKFGAKYRAKNKDRDNNAVIFEPEDDLFLTDYDANVSGKSTIISGRYPLGIGFPASKPMRDLLANGNLDSEFDHESDAADYDASEDVYAGYGMLETFLGGKSSLVAGVRYEYTDVDYLGYEVVYDEEGDWVESMPIRGTNNYGEVLPSVHFKYALDDDTNLRAAVTRTLARPNFSQLVPTQLVLREDLEIERGNPDLNATTSWNLDLMGERYFSSIGVLSAGVFYKELSDYIYVFRFDEERDGETYEVNQPLNGDSATLVGVELVYQNQLRFLPAPFDGLGLYLNYTWTDSEAQFPDRDGKSTLPGQAEGVGNFAISYERAGFSTRLSLNYHSEYINEVGGEPAEDLYIDEHTQLDFSASYEFMPGLRFYVEAINLTDEPYRIYEGSPDRPIVEEYYSWWGSIGIKWSL